LEEEELGTDIFHMDHAMHLRFEARVAAVQEYREQLADPKRRLESLRALPTAPRELPAPAKTVRAAAAETPIEGELANLTAEQMARKFVEANPKLTASMTGKREARWTDKTRSQFETAMRLLEKSMGTKPFVELTNEDLRQLLEHFDGLPPNHHKSPRHGPMSLEAICAEAQSEVKKGKLEKKALGLNIPTLNRHFRFIRMAHTWCRKQLPQLNELNWEAYSFRDSRNARDQRDAFPVDVARKLFLLPPWQGCANRRQRFKPGREVFHDSVYWVLPIIWYSGMRREEACKLQVSEIVLSPEGIWYFDVVASEAGRLKNTASKRRVPIASELLRLGFLDFVNVMRNAGEKLLFPELASDTRAMGEMYYRHAWKKLLEVFDGPTEGLSTHAIRHMVADELKAVRIDHEIRADLLGHALEDETGGRYSKAARLAVLQEAVDKIPVVTKTVRKEPIWRP
jgi:integrase